MRLELQQIGALCIALLLGGFISLSLFLVMVFLIEPERMINSHMPRSYVVKFVALGQKKETKKTPDKSIRFPKISRNPELTPITTSVPRKVMRKKISVHPQNIGPIDAYGAGRDILDLYTGTEENYYSKGNRKVLFNQVERKYLQSKKEKTLPPERVRIPGGGEIDRFGNTCFEVSSVGGSGGGDTGQTAIEKDQSFAMHSLSAREVPCSKSNSSFVEDFLKQLKKRELIMAPVSVTN